MLRENTYATFWLKNCYIFIKSGRKWLKRHDNESRTSYVSSLISPFNRSTQAILKPCSVDFFLSLKPWRQSHENEL